MSSPDKSSEDHGRLRKVYRGFHSTFLGVYGSVSGVVKAKEFLGLVALLSTAVAAFSAWQSRRNADTTTQLFKLQLQPTLYLECKTTEKQVVFTSAAPDVFLIVSDPEETGSSSVVSEGYSLGPSVTPDPSYPTWMERCTLTNYGKAAAIDLRIGFDVIIVDQLTLDTAPGSKDLSHGYTIPQNATLKSHRYTLVRPVLPPSVAFTFVAYNRAKKTAWVLPHWTDPKTPSAVWLVKYKVALNSQDFSTELLHNNESNQLTLRSDPSTPLLTQPKRQ